VVWHDDVSPEEWDAELDAIFADPAFPPGNRVLADLRSAGGLPTITDEVVSSAAARFDNERLKLQGIRLAIVPNGAWDKAVQLAYRDYSVPGFRAILFTDLQNACGWLGLPLTTATPVLARLRADLRAAP
jgi:hypothetical protein